MFIISGLHVYSAFCTLIAINQQKHTVRVDSTLRVHSEVHTGTGMGCSVRAPLIFPLFVMPRSLDLIVSHRAIARDTRASHVHH
jgi:hypothetical protein